MSESGRGSGKHEPPTLEVRVKGPGIDWTQNVPLALGLEVIRRLSGGDWSVSGSQTQGVRENEPSGETSIREFVERAEPRANQQRIVAFAEYLRLNRRKSTVTEDELLAAFEEARETAPANFRRDLGKALDETWIAPKVGYPGVYYVTRKGQEAVATHFSRKSAPRARKAKSA